MPEITPVEPDPDNAGEGKGAYVGFRVKRGILNDLQARTQRNRSRIIHPVRT